MTVPPTQHLRRAIRLAMNGRGRVEPNPMVGCVIVTRRPRHRRGLPPAVRRPPRRAERPGRLHRIAGRGDGLRHARAVLPHGQEDAAVRPAADRRAGGAGRRRLPRPQPVRERRRRADAPRRRRRGGRAGAGGRVQAVDRGVPEARWRIVAALHDPEVGGVGRPHGSPEAAADGSRSAIRRPRASCKISALAADGILVGINTVLNDDPTLLPRGLPVPERYRRFILDTHLRTPADSHLVRSVNQSDVVVLSAWTRRPVVPGAESGPWSSEELMSGTRSTTWTGGCYPKATGTSRIWLVAATLT